MLPSLQTDRFPSTKTSGHLDSGSLDFLWLELTNRCNLECIHCYADYSPEGKHSTLSAQRQVELLSEARSLGCERVQFIGGEPTLNRALPFLISEADGLGFDFIEVYTNLVALTDHLLECFRRHRVHVATSVYSNSPEIHDTVTARSGSWNSTARNIERVVARGISIRASIVEMDINFGASDATSEWLRGIGVSDIGTDRLRHFGRGTDRQDCLMSELCGSCASGTLCVSPDGTVSPCIMSKSWPVGYVGTGTLAAIAASSQLRDTRKAIYDATNEGTTFEMGCNPDRKYPCGPDSQTCRPCNPNTHCGPNDCQPVRNPKK
jgi:sulfatase maturation enzyme AslB (radical SAM superfamily)